MIESFLKECKIVKVMDSQAAGVTDPASDIVDTAGFEGCAFVCKLGAVVDAGAVTLKVQQNVDNSATGMADLSGASAAIAETSSDGEQSLAVEVNRPKERYLRAVVVRDTQNSEVDAMYAVLYNPCNIPVTQPATIDASAYVVSPAEA
jgi:hypothetical protein